MELGMTWMFANFIYLFAFITSVHSTIFVISEETNETVRVIYEKNIRAVSDAVEGYVVISNPLNACEPVEPAPGRKRSNGNATSTDDSLYAFDEEGRVERDWVLLSIVYDCDVTTKARNAQLGGYKALIIQNIGSNDSQHIPWHILRFPLVKLNHVLVGEHDGDLLRFNFSYPNNRYYVKFEEDKFYQLMCYILIGIIIVLLSTMFALFWVQICCAIIIVVPHQLRQVLQRWLQPGKRRLTRPMLQMLTVKNWTSTDPFQVCAICQEDFKENDKLRVLPCLHGFHAMCVDPWLLRRSRRCPCCMQRVRLPNDKNEEPTEEETDNNFLTSSGMPTFERTSTSSGEAPPNDQVEDPLLTESILEARLNSALMSHPRSDVSIDPYTLTSHSGSRRSSQDGEAVDWQLRRFLQGCKYNPSDPWGIFDMTPISRQQGYNSCQNMHNILHEGNTLNNQSNMPSTSQASKEKNALTDEDPAKLLDNAGSSLDNVSQACSTDVGNSTLEVQVGTVATEDGSYHLSSPYPASSNNTFTVSTTRDRRTSDATTISGSLPRDESSFHIVDEIHSEIISEEVFAETVDSSVAANSDQDDTAQADKE